MCSPGFPVYAISSAAQKSRLADATMRINHKRGAASVAKIPPRIQAKCQRADTPISRDTLYLIAKQPTEAKMLQVLKDSQTGAPREARREKARKGKGREGAASKKPKRTYTSAKAQVTVILQSHTSTLTKQREIEALKNALKERKAK